jgi:hypothetical protein
LLEAVRRASQFTHSYLLEAHPVSLAKNIFTIGFDPEFADKMSLVDTARNHTLLQTKLAELGHHNTQIKFIKAEAPSGFAAVQPAAGAPAPSPIAPSATPTPTPAAAPTAPKRVESGEKKTASVPFSKDDFKNDPLIQKALEVFKGTIVEVRA